MAKILSAELHQEYSAKLEQLLDEHDDVREKRARIGKALGGELKIIAEQIVRTRRVLKGVESPQTEIPGTEVGERKRDPAVATILTAAAKVAQREEEKTQREEGRPAAAVARPSIGWGEWNKKRRERKGKGARGRVYTVNEDRTPLFKAGVGYSWSVASTGLGTAGEGPFETEAEAQRRAEAEESRRRGNRLPLRWTDEADGRILGIASDGLVYSVERLVPDGARWVQGRKRSIRLPSVAAAKIEADRAELQRQADERLENAGDRAMTAKNLTGPAETRRKGGRRG